MPSEIRALSVRTQVARLLDDAAKILRDGEELLTAIGKAQGKVKTAQALAHYKPPGSRAVPPAIRRATDAAARRLDALAIAVRNTPITKIEKASAKR